MRQRWDGDRVRSRGAGENHGKGDGSEHKAMMGIKRQHKDASDMHVSHYMYLSQNLRPIHGKAAAIRKPTSNANQNNYVANQERACTTHFVQGVSVETKYSSVENKCNKSRSTDHAYMWENLTKI